MINILTDPIIYTTIISNLSDKSMILKIDYRDDYRPNLYDGYYLLYKKKFI